MLKKQKPIYQQIIKFYEGLEPNFVLPKSVSVMLPFNEMAVKHFITKFYTKFFNDYHERVFIFGINPGRFGGGLTGIPFTDPLRLNDDCSIPNDLSKRGELSAEFVYKVIKAFGGVEDFYSKFFITSICPVGFVKDGINLNYYDDKKLEKAATPYIVDTIRQQLELGARRDVCICLGSGKNLKFMQKLNQEHDFFENIIPLDHPRFIMQYKRKELEHYISKYLITLKALLKKSI